MAVISFNGFSIKLTEDFNPEFEYILPIELSKNNAAAHPSAIWVMPHQFDRSKSYVGQIWGALQYYKDKLSQPSILLGDFNSNAIWDEKTRVGDHSDLVSYLTQNSISSLYHSKFDIKQGTESDPTLYLLKN